jgi:hypothetical protein
MRTSWKTILETSASEHTSYSFSIFYSIHPRTARVFDFSLILFFFYISIFSYPEFLDTFKIQSGLKDMASLLHGNGLEVLLFDLFIRLLNSEVHGIKKKSIVPAQAV